MEYADYKLDSSPIAADALDLLDARFKAISSLKEVIVNVHVYDYEGLSDDLRKKMRDCGWTIKVTKLEESEYDLEEDEYADYQYYLEMKREQELEDEAWRNITGDAILTGRTIRTTIRTTIKHIVTRYQMQLLKPPDIAPACRKLSLPLRM